jgi:phage baseplate assembly protein V
MDKLKNANRSDIMRALAKLRAQTRAGTITGYDPTNYMAQVEISPELVQTGWLPIMTPWAGNDFGFYVGPDIGTQVIVLHLEDDFESGMVLLYVNDDSHRPPPVPSGEMWAVHKSNSFLKFTNDGNVALMANNDLNISAGGDINMTATGNVNIDGAQVNLGGAGGKKVDLDQDVVSGGKVQSSATKVFAQ